MEITLETYDVSKAAEFGALVGPASEIKKENRMLKWIITSRGMWRTEVNDWLILCGKDGMFWASSKRLSVGKTKHATRALAMTWCQDREDVLSCEPLEFWLNAYAGHAFGKPCKSSYEASEIADGSVVRTAVHMREVKPDREIIYALKQPGGGGSPWRGTSDSLESIKGILGSGYEFYECEVIRRVK